MLQQGSTRQAERVAVATTPVRDRVAVERVELSGEVSDPAPSVDQLEPSTDLHTDFSVHEGVAAVPEDQVPASVDKAVSIGEVVVRSKSEAQRRAGELEVEKKLRRAASSPLEVGGPVEPRVEHEDARRKQWEEELRHELEVQRAEMRRCHGRDRAVSAV